MSGPIKPSEITTAKAESIPEEVFESFNDLIAKNYSGKTSKVEQNDVVDLITYKMDVNRSKIFEQDWLEIDELYREAGWHVVYTKPDYTENYKPFWVFTKK